MRIWTDAKLCYIEEEEVGATVEACGHAFEWVDCRHRRPGQAYSSSQRDA